MPEIELKTYRYLRMSIVMLLIGLGVAVVYQTQRQGFLLGSVSAYYFTPAQGIFVGSLIGLAACMIALKGTTNLEDVFLNLGGMFAAVVAVVPAARGKDFEAAVHACEQAAGPLLTYQAGSNASSALDCPTVQALQDATKANVLNNMVSLLVIGGVSLIVTLVFALRDRKSSAEKPGRGFAWGFTTSALLWALAWVALYAKTENFIRYGHYVAAAGLFGSVLIVTFANAWRRRPGGGTLIGRLAHLDRYAVIGWAMLAGLVATGALILAHMSTLFWLEVVVTALFATFWVVQTLELIDTTSTAVPTPAQPSPAPASTGS